MNRLTQQLAKLSLFAGLIIMALPSIAQNTVMPALSPEELKQFNSQPLSPKISVPELDGTETGPTRNGRMNQKMQAPSGAQSAGEKEAEELEGGGSVPLSPQITKSF
ncbi:hypothetical protein ICU98_05645 [Polynucleobacter sp. MWH-P3-07-1]|uniref:hypothetical protein n=1 Tax=Polynucleobacter sp. MWH-P3-07-1 TaxID=1743173 RepID=UPI001BFE78A1|nr:hypothetical protein [Polynucleobacter sp. MWH-P3-07-1]QWD82929.1 hypothetical protein ICU98_05645 [Polynucleobacter sp. MWH-P3-07-1]